MTHAAANTLALAAMPRDQTGPVFAEPWQATAFALAVNLAEAGCFTWAEWAAILGEEIAAAQQRGDPDLGHTYYHHWLNALEQLCVQKGLVAALDMNQRKHEWRHAYLNTPHGQPVELAAGLSRVKGQTV
jgi:nitrile hydratase accessory protein